MLMLGVNRSHWVRGQPRMDTAAHHTEHTVADL